MGMKVISPINLKTTEKRYILSKKHLKITRRRRILWRAVSPQNFRSKEIKLKSQWIIDNQGENYVIPKIKELGEMSQEAQPVNITNDAPEKSEKKNKFLSKYDNEELSPINKNLN